MTVTYSKNTGSSGEMQIRDTGTRVEFWLNSHNSTTFNHSLPWGRTVNGDTNNSFHLDYSAGDGWVKAGDWSVTTSQTVNFHIGDTGTSGFGGPTDFSKFIDRSTVPAAPTTPVISNVGSTQVDVVFSDGSNGGLTIDSRQIGYSTSSAAPATIIASDGSTTVTGLSPGTTYYFWARTHNSKGYSAWSARSQATTLRVPDAPNRPTVTNVGPTSVTIEWTPNGNGGSPITDYDVGFGTSPAAPTIVNSDEVSPYTQIGLTPGVTYYFFVRANNVVGASAWSPSVTAQTIAGLRVKDGGIWKLAIPYVKDAGVWKLAVPYVKDGGVWKGTT